MGLSCGEICKEIMDIFGWIWILVGVFILKLCTKLPKQIKVFLVHSVLFTFIFFLKGGDISGEHKIVFRLWKGFFFWYLFNKSQKSQFQSTYVYECDLYLKKNNYCNKYRTPQFITLVLFLFFIKYNIAQCLWQINFKNLDKDKLGK